MNQVSTEYGKGWKDMTGSEITMKVTEMLENAGLDAEAGGLKGVDQGTSILVP